MQRNEDIGEKRGEYRLVQLPGVKAFALHPDRTRARLRKRDDHRVAALDAGLDLAEPVGAASNIFEIDPDVDAGAPKRLGDE